MNQADLELLKASVDRPVQIETLDGEILTAKIIWVFDEEDSPDLFYDLVATTRPEMYLNPRHEGYAMPLKDILRVTPAP